MNEPILTPELEQEIRDIAASYPECSWSIVLRELDALRATLAAAEHERDEQRKAADHWFKEANREHNDRIRAEQANAELVGILQSVRWSGTAKTADGHTHASCPYCHAVLTDDLHTWNIAEETGSHEPDCKLAALLARCAPETPK